MSGSYPLSTNPTNPITHSSLDPINKQTNCKAWSRKNCRIGKIACNTSYNKKGERPSHFNIFLLPSSLFLFLELLVSPELKGPAFWLVLRLTTCSKKSFPGDGAHREDCRWWLLRRRRPRRGGGRRGDGRQGGDWVPDMSGGGRRGRHGLTLRLRWHAQGEPSALFIPPSLQVFLLLPGCRGTEVS